MKTPDTDPVRSWLTHGSLAAGIAFTASAEYDLALTLGATPWVAVMLPLAIDAYVVSALRWFRAADIALSLALMGAAQVAAHLIDSGVMQVNIPMVVVVSLLVPIAVWRTHALARGGEKTPEPVPAATPAAAVAEPARRPLPDVVPAGARLLPLMARPDVDEHDDQETPPAWAVTVPDDAKVLPIVPRPPKRKELPPGRSTALATRPSRKPAVPAAPTQDAELLAKARGDFPDGAGVKALRDAYGIGQARAQRIRDQLLNDETTFTVVRDYREEASA